MSEEFLDSLKDAKEGTLENKLDLFLSISQKIVSLLFAIESQNKRLWARVERLEKLNKSAIPLAVAPPPPPPPVPSKAPVNSGTVRQDIMGELKALFKKREDVGK